MRGRSRAGVDPDARRAGTEPGDDRLGGGVCDAVVEARHLPETRTFRPLIIVELDPHAERFPLPTCLSLMCPRPNLPYFLPWTATLDVLPSRMVFR